jgi:phosphatidylglycerol:prolipoprotein diacylglycerol transferase
MWPEICRIGPFTVYSYGMMLAVAVILCAALMGREAQRIGTTREMIYDLIFWLVVGGIAGARIFYIVLNWEMFRGHPLEILMVQHGGLAWQGGLLGGGLAGWGYIKKKALPLWSTLDLAAPYIALGHAIGRIGCFLNGCCYGREVSWGIYFPVHGAHLHPTQLYDVGGLLIVFLILKFFQKRRGWPAGQLFVCYLTLASIQRFINEFFRGDHQHTFWGLSIYQWVSIGIFTVGLVLWGLIKVSYTHHKISK